MFGYYKQRIEKFLRRRKIRHFQGFKTGNLTAFLADVFTPNLVMAGLPTKLRSYARDHFIWCKFESPLDPQQPSAYSQFATMATRCNIAIVYGETKLHQTMSISTSATVAQAKQHGSETILRHLRLQPGVLSTISLDDECTDFYPRKIQL